MNEFCPKCGKTEGSFIDGFCRKCYLEDHELILLPEVFEIEKCSKCGRIKIFGKWVDFTEKNTAEFLEKKVKIKELANPELKIGLEGKSEREYVVEITASGFLSGQEIEAEKSVPLRFSRLSCQDCGKLAAGYFEAKVQIRWEKGRDEKKEKRLSFEIMHGLARQRANDSLAVITKRETLPNGLDLFIGSNSAARVALAQAKKKFKVKILTTKKLVGRTKSGKSRFQFTYRLRF